MRRCKLRLNGEDYLFLLKGKSTFLLTICRDKPEIFCSVSDMIIPGLSIVEPMNQADALNKIICEGYHPLIIEERVLSICMVDEELNRNFMRILSTFPLVAQANGKREVAHFLFFAVLAIDQTGVLLEKVHQGVKRFLFHLFKKFVSVHISSPAARISFCEFFSTFDKGLTFCDKYCHNFVRIEKGKEYLVCNTKACQLGGEMGEFIEDHIPNGQHVADKPFTRLQMTAESGLLIGFSSQRCQLYEIGNCKLFIGNEPDHDNLKKTLHVFCNEICVHSGKIDAACIFYMLNAIGSLLRKDTFPFNLLEETEHTVSLLTTSSVIQFFFSVSRASGLAKACGLGMIQLWPVPTPEANTGPRATTLFSTAKNIRDSESCRPKKVLNVKEIQSISFR